MYLQVTLQHANGKSDIVHTELWKIVYFHSTGITLPGRAVRNVFFSDETKRNENLPVKKKSKRERKRKLSCWKKSKRKRKLSCCKRSKRKRNEISLRFVRHFEKKWVSLLKLYIPSGKQVRSDHHWLPCAKTDLLSLCRQAIVALSSNYCVRIRQLKGLLSLGRLGFLIGHFSHCSCN